MHVLMTGDAVGGVWTYAVDLAGALAAHGVRVTLVTMGPPPSAEQSAAARRIDGLQIVATDYKLEWMDDAWPDVEAAGRWLLNLEATLRPDIVHLNGYAHGTLPFSAPVVIVGHSCMLSWAEAIPGAIDERALEVYRAHVTPGIRAARHLVAPSRALLAALDRFYGPLPPASVIPNGRSSAVFRPAEKQPFVFTAGRLWDRAKNIEAVAAIAPRLPWPVAIAGEQGSPGSRGSHGSRGSQGSQGSLRENPVNPTNPVNPMNLVNPVNPVNPVRMLGKLGEADLARVLAHAAIFALPARYEPFGLMPVEAALSGCALVLGDIPSLREVWADAAEFVRPDDHEALYEAVGALIAAPARLHERAQAARARASMYTPERMAAAYATLYESLAPTRHTRSVACAS